MKIEIIIKIILKKENLEKIITDKINNINQKDLLIKENLNKIKITMKR